MSIEQVQFAGLSVSRFIIGGNPFSTVSHQGQARDLEMRQWYTTARIKATLAEAEASGVTTFLGRADNHVIRMLCEYRDEGGQIDWIAQTTPELASIERSVSRALGGGANAIFVHGGQTDQMLAKGELGKVTDIIQRIRDAGLPAGIAGHNPDVHRWAEDHLDVDFYMCCYYNPSRRDEKAERDAEARETYRDEDRQIMVSLIQSLRRPAIHYKIMAAGRNDPDEAFAFAVAHMRPTDATCVGVHTKDNPDMVRENVERLSRCLGQAAAKAA
ncbi:MAG TPA: hypothetical protein DIC52_13160 [Candidatus Latescibacteria bacterium]|jgi:hypothetical protein|nr:hypothetical protein [Candidatus Latescibacterota bacterium]